MKNNIINLKTHPLYIKNMVKGKTLNLFGAPIPAETLICYFESFEKYLKTPEKVTPNTVDNLLKM